MSNLEIFQDFFFPNNFSVPSALSKSNHMFIIPQVTDACFIFSSLFSLCTLFCIYSISVSSSSLIISSAESNLLLIPSSVFLISDIVIFLSLEVQVGFFNIVHVSAHYMHVFLPSPWTNEIHLEQLNEHTLVDSFCYVSFLCLFLLIDVSSGSRSYFLAFLHAESLYWMPDIVNFMLLSVHFCTL